MMAQRSHQRRLSHPSYSAKSVPGAKRTFIAGVDHVRFAPKAEVTSTLETDGDGLYLLRPNFAVRFDIDTRLGDQ